VFGVGPDAGGAGGVGGDRGSGAYPLMPTQGEWAPDVLLVSPCGRPRPGDYGAWLHAGPDCRAVVADPVLRALSDLEIFQAALAEGRVPVTNNVPDFERLRRAHEVAGDVVPGLICTSDLTFPRTKAHVSRLGAALAAAAADRETARCGGVLWLRPPGPGHPVGIPRNPYSTQRR